MSVATQQSPVVSPPTRGGGTVTHRFRVVTTDEPDALMRVLVLLRRRGCTVVGLDYARADRHRHGRLEVVVHTDSRAAHRLRAWLLQLVDVVVVDEER
jgi:acetolactate synthase regulatory subunit